MIHHALPSWPRRHLRGLLWSRRLGPGFALAAAITLGSLSTLAVWYGPGHPAQRLVFVLCLAALAGGAWWHVYATATLINPARAGVQAEARALRALQGFGDDVHVWSNLRPPGWPYDVDLVVLTPTRLVVVEVKADPGRLQPSPRGPVSLRGHDGYELKGLLALARTRSIRFKLHLIHAAKNGRLPPGIPTPHALVAIDPLHPSPPLALGGVVHADALPAAIQALPANLPARLHEPLTAFLDGEAAA